MARPSQDHITLPAWASVGASTAGVSEDIAHGQVVIVTFRWIMAVAGFLFALWNPGPVGELRVQILVIFALAVANFYLHAQLLMGRPSLDLVVFGASAVDLSLISVLVATGGGFDSSLFMYYYPAVLVFSVAFPTAVTFAFTAGALALYTLIGQPAMTAEDNVHVAATRLLSLAAIAVCGHLYWRIERDRRREAALRGGLARSEAQEGAEDLFFGQVVILAARWALIAAGAVVVLWTAREQTELITGILPVVALMAVNFFLHGRYLLEQPANRMLTVAATLIDLVVITAVVLAWPGPQGLASPLFVLYYPVLVGFAFVFPPAASAAYTGLALVGYAGTCFLADPSFVDSSRQVELLVQRLTTMAAVGGLATYYWRIQRARRRLARRPNEG